MAQIFIQLIPSLSHIQLSLAMIVHLLIISVLLIVQDIKNNNGPMIGPSAWQRGVGCFDEIPDFDMDEYYSDEGGSSGGNPRDEKVFDVLMEIGGGDRVGFNKWFEAVSKAGVYKNKKAFSD